MPAAIPPRRTPAEREDALRTAVRGTELDAEAERVLTWLAQQRTDVTTVLVRLFEGTRAAGMESMATLAHDLREATGKAPRMPGGFVPGNSGPGY